jgi:hypothetical protein
MAIGEMARGSQSGTEDKGAAQCFATAIELSPAEFAGRVLRHFNGKKSEWVAGRCHEFSQKLTFGKAGCERLLRFYSLEKRILLHEMCLTPSFFNRISKGNTDSYSTVRHTDEFE